MSTTTESLKKDIQENNTLQKDTLDKDTIVDKEAQEETSETSETSKTSDTKDNHQWTLEQNSLPVKTFTGYTLNFQKWSSKTHPQDSVKEEFSVPSVPSTQDQEKKE